MSRLLGGEGAPGRCGSGGSVPQGCRDTFDVHYGGTLARGVDGGDGGFDTLAYSGGTCTNVVSAAVDSHSGPVTTDGAIMRYAGLEPEVLPHATNITLGLNSGDRVVVHMVK